MKRKFRVPFSIRTFAVLMAILVAMQVADRQEAERRDTHVKIGAVAVEAHDREGSALGVCAGLFSFAFGGGKGPPILF
ncbi:hypothetical protein PX699_09795 [Sphingobium sp. H39-3-25]|uniref:hypothetical protein n=1 Tax=Sphingobium arseniciresistens TaxID=3030834 RepID=UPI0023B8CAC9|nr:hypothetical protein [Sphingobium arseniciresistens]